MSRRRANREGTIYRRSDGRWEAKITVAIVAGRQKRKSVYGKTRADAREKLIKLQAQIQAGLSVPDDRMTIGVWLDRWDSQIEKKAYKTRISYRQIVRDYLRHPKVGLDRDRMSTLNADRIQRWLDDLAACGVSPPTVKYSLDILRIALRAAQRADLIQRQNPASLVTAPSWRRRQAKPFTGTGARDFLSAIREDRLYPLLLLALTSGLRRGELLGLRWSDIDTATRTLWVRQQVQRQKGKGLVVVPTKTERSEAAVAIPNLTLRGLETHRARMREERLALGPEWQGMDDPGASDSFVFVSKLGSMLDGDTVWRHFKELLVETAAGDRRLHDSRHTTGSVLQALGVPMHVIKDILRHTRIATTERYSHGDLEQQHAAADKLDELLGGYLG